MCTMFHTHTPLTDNEYQKPIHLPIPLRENIFTAPSDRFATVVSRAAAPHTRGYPHSFAKRKIIHHGYTYHSSRRLREGLAGGQLREGLAGGRQLREGLAGGRQLCENLAGGRQLCESLAGGQLREGAAGGQLREGLVFWRMTAVSSRVSPSSRRPFP